MTIDITDAVALRHIIGNLTDLYSDPALAAIREYSTNALDSHLQAGIDKAIEVTVPTDRYATSGHFTVQDFGVGLSREDLRKVYSKYGSSTKREDENAVGTLGLGCKSGLSYAPLGFTVTAVKDGAKVLATITKDENTGGVIRILDESATNEPNGVKISIPIKPNDAYLFIEKVAEFFRYWKPGTVLVNGEPPAYFDDDADAIWVDEDIALTKEGQSVVVMGNVAYPFSRRTSLGHGIVAYIPMGSVHFPSSREALQYTALTNDTLDEVVNFANHWAEQTVVKHIVEAENPWERVKRWHAWEGRLPRELRTRIQVAADLYATTVRLPFAVWTDEDGVKRKAADRKIGYKWSPSYNRRHETSRCDNWVPWSWLQREETPIVTGYPYQAKNLSPTVKERLRAFFNREDAILVPEGTNLDLLDGRPNIYVWSEIVELTPRERAPKGEGKTKTLYNVFTGKRGNYSVEEVKPKDGPIVYLAKDEHHRKVAQFPEVQFVELRWNQHDKFLRNHPTAIDWNAFWSAERTKIEAALTDDDILVMQKGSGVISGLSYFSDLIPQVDDPDLQRIFQTVNAKSDRADRANALGITLPAHPLWAAITDRYPLLQTLEYEARSHAEDVVLYLNAKFGAHQTNNTGVIAS